MLTCLLSSRLPANVGDFGRVTHEGPSTSSGPDPALILDMGAYQVLERNDGSKSAKGRTSGSSFGTKADVKNNIRTHPSRDIGRMEAMEEEKEEEEEEEERERENEKVKEDDDDDEEEEEEEEKDLDMQDTDTKGEDSVQIYQVTKNSMTVFMMLRNTS